MNPDLFIQRPKPTEKQEDIEEIEKDFLALKFSNPDFKAAAKTTYCENKQKPGKLFLFLLCLN